MLAALAVTDKVAGRSAIVMMGATTGEGAAPWAAPSRRLDLGLSSQRQIRVHPEFHSLCHS